MRCIDQPSRSCMPSSSGSQVAKRSAWRYHCRQESRQLFCSAVASIMLLIGLLCLLSHCRIDVLDRTCRRVALSEAAVIAAPALSSAPSPDPCSALSPDRTSQDALGMASSCSATSIYFRGLTATTSSNVQRIVPMTSGCLDEWHLSPSAADHLSAIAVRLGPLFASVDWQRRLPPAAARDGLKRLSVYPPTSPQWRRRMFPSR